MSNQDMKAKLEVGPDGRFDGLFYSKSDEKFTVRALLDEIFAQRTFASSLDVGPGLGHISEPLVSRSKRITMVEKQVEYKEGLVRQFENAQVVIQSIADFSSDEPFDVILFSHVLYYHDEAKWLEITKRLYDMLTDNGELILILNSDVGDWWRIVGQYWNSLRSNIGFQYIPLTTFRKQLATLGPIKVHPYRYQMWIEPGATWSEFVGKQLLEIDDQSVLDANESSFVELAQSFKQVDGSYVLDMRAEIIRLQVDRRGK